MNDAQRMSANICDEVLVVSLNNMPYCDPVREQMLLFIDSNLDIFANNENIKVMIIKYCKFINITKQTFSKLSDSVRGDVERRRHRLIGARQICAKIEGLNKPVAVAHQSECSGDDLLIALSCDFRIAETSAIFKFPDGEVREPPSDFAVKKLVELVGSHWARLLVMANLPLDAKEAQIAGLVHKIIPSASFDEDLLKFCRHIALQVPEGGGGAKRQVIH